MVHVVGYQLPNQETWIRFLAPGWENLSQGATEGMWGDKPVDGISLSPSNKSINVMKMNDSQFHSAN